MAKEHEIVSTIGTPRMVGSHNIQLDEEYALWMADLKNRYRKAQVRAAIKVNAEQLLFNWQLGRDLVLKKAEERWGAGVVEQVSLDLKAEFPGVSGFSTTNLWSMKKWYSFYSTPENIQILHQAVAEFEVAYETNPIKYQQITDVEHVKNIFGKMKSATFAKRKVHEKFKNFRAKRHKNRQVKFSVTCLFYFYSNAF